MAALVRVHKKRNGPFVVVFFVTLLPHYIDNLITYRQFNLVIHHPSTSINMADGNELTARENEVLALAWQCMESDPKVRVLPVLFTLTHTDIAT